MRVFHDSVLVSKYMQRPTGRCCFYRRFVRFNTALLYSENDSHIYQSQKCRIHTYFLNSRQFLNASPTLRKGIVPSQIKKHRLTVNQAVFSA